MHHHNTIYTLTRSIGVIFRIFFWWALQKVHLLRHYAGNLLLPYDVSIYKWTNTSFYLLPSFMCHYLFCPCLDILPAFL